MHIVNLQELSIFKCFMRWFFQRTTLKGKLQESLFGVCHKFKQILLKIFRNHETITILVHYNIDSFMLGYTFV